MESSSLIIFVVGAQAVVIHAVIFFNNLAVKARDDIIIANQNTIITLLNGTGLT